MYAFLVAGKNCNKPFVNVTKEENERSSVEVVIHGQNLLTRVLGNPEIQALLLSLAKSMQG